MKNKMKNPYFYIGIIGVVFSSVGIDMTLLTNWSLFSNALLDIVKNPMTLVSVILALIGVYNDNSTKGLDKFNGCNSIEDKTNI